MLWIYQINFYALTSDGKYCIIIGGDCMLNEAQNESSVGVYHVMIKGLNNEQIYKKEIYKDKILQLIRDMKEEIDFSVIAYCVMDNHLHMLLKNIEDNLAIIMRRINIKYAIYYNNCEEKNGYVFQNRFKSQRVSHDMLLRTMRYIHNKPVKAKISKNICNYYWSSVNDYLGGGSNLVCEKHIAAIKNIFNSKDKFIDYHNIFDDCMYLDTKEEQNRTIEYIIDNTAEDLIKEKEIEGYKYRDNKNIKQFSYSLKEELVRSLIKYEFITNNKIADKCGLSVREVSEIKSKIKTIKE